MRRFVGACGKPDGGGPIISLLLRYAPAGIRSTVLPSPSRSKRSTPRASAFDAPVQVPSGTPAAVHKRKSSAAASAYRGSVVTAAGAAWSLPVVVSQLAKV